MDVLSRVLLLSLLAFNPLKVQGQLQKKIAKEDYGLWGSLEFKSVSPSGRWANYAMHYQGGKDTLFVKNTKDGTTFTFPLGLEVKFRGDDFFACLDANGSLVARDLKTGKTFWQPNVEAFEFVGGDNISVLCMGTEGSKTLLVMDASGKALARITNVLSFATSPDRLTVAISVKADTESKVVLLEIGKVISQKVIAIIEGASFSRVSWQESGKSLAFASSGGPEADVLFLYRPEEKQMLKTEMAVSFSAWGSNIPIAISPDGKRVFISGKAEKIKKETPSGVEVWNAADAYLPPYLRKYGVASSLLAWWPDSNRIEIVGGGMRVANLTTAMDYALLADSRKYKPSLKFKPDADYHVQNLATGEVRLLAEKLPSLTNSPHLSPDGKYIAYFQEGDWQVYSIASGKKQNATEGSGAIFSSNEKNHPQETPPYGIAGWSADGLSLLFYDKYDLWSFSIKTGKLQAFTNGRASGRRYRISGSEPDASSTAWIGRHEPVIPLEKEIALEVSGDEGMTGFAVLEKGKNVREHLFTRRKISRLKKSLCGSKYFYLEEDFNLSPCIKLFDADSKKYSTLYSSNPQDKLYNWGGSEMLDYKDSKGNQLKGALFYPFDYNPSKKYPMLVYIYEKLSQGIHSYMKPTLYNLSGFNKTVYASEGYFVLYPDIAYEIGNPGFSATDCVIAATKTAMASASIDSKRIGLMGHSFGGYETGFIITQTKLFAAAATGSGIADLTSKYLSVSGNYAMDEAWRFESDQFRMGNSFFDDMEGYLANSTIMHVKEIRTPLITFTGGKDRQVNPLQSMELFTALRRLGKEHYMLLYPEEDHSWTNPDNQKDLTIKLLEWFDYYTKGNTRPSWMASQEHSK